MKKIGIMQPYLFPYIGYFQVMHAVDEYVIYDDVNFIKGGWINRNNLLLNRERKLFSIALSQASPNKLINEIDIQDDFQNFLKTLTMTYAKAPYYEPTIKLIRGICDFPNKNLATFIANSFSEITQYLSIDTKLIVSSDLNKDNEMRAQNKVIHICKNLGATEYINAIGGQELYDHETFQAHGIELKFLQTGTIQYKQFGNEFVPNLSIIDIMMFNSPEEIRQMLGNYELI